MPDYVTFDIDKKRRKDQRNKLLSLPNEKKVQVLYNIKLYSFHPLTIWLEDLEENLTAEFFRIAKELVYIFHTNANDNEDIVSIATEKFILLVIKYDPKVKAKPFYDPEKIKFTKCVRTWVFYSYCDMCGFNAYMTEYERKNCTALKQIEYEYFKNTGEEISIEEHTRLFMEKTHAKEKTAKKYISIYYSKTRQNLVLHTFESDYKGEVDSEQYSLYDNSSSASLESLYSPSAETTFFSNISGISINAFLKIFSDLPKEYLCFYWECIVNQSQASNLKKVSHKELGKIDEVIAAAKRTHKKDFLLSPIPVKYDSNGIEFIPERTVRHYLSLIKKLILKHKNIDLFRDVITNRNALRTD